MFKFYNIYSNDDVCVKEIQEEEEQQQQQPGKFLKVNIKKK